jgi:heme exporter protein D
LSGIFAGLAVLVKAVAGYIVAGAAVAVVLNTLGLKHFWRDPQVYAMAALMVAPTALRYMNRGSLASEYVTNWTVALSHLLLEPGFYVRWLGFVQNLVGLVMLVLGLVGVVISQPRSRALLLGLWVGYFIYGLTLPYQMFTHSYYHLQLVPIVALSIAPVAEIILRRVAQERRIWQAFFVGVLLIALANASWLGIFPQYVEDHRTEPAHWQAVAAQLPSDGKIIALTQDYGFPLMYYGWRKVDLWPNRGEQKLMKLRGSEKEFEEYFLKQTEGKSYFLITSFSQFNAELDLKQYLSEHYPVLATEEDYIIFDLRNSLP